MPYRSSENQNRVEFIRKKFEKNLSEENYNTVSKKTNDIVCKTKSNEISKNSNVDKTEAKAVIKRTPAFRREKIGFVKSLPKMPCQKTENAVVDFILNGPVHINLESQSQNPNAKAKEAEKNLPENSIKDIQRSKTDFFRNSNSKSSNKIDSIKSTLISKKLNLLAESETNKSDILSSYAVVNKNLKKKNSDKKSGQSDLKLSESLRKALQSPLPEGPPPKKPPRTFCHVSKTSNPNTQKLEEQKKLVPPSDIPQLKSKLEKLEKAIKSHDKTLNVTVPRKAFEKKLEEKLSVIPNTTDSRLLPSISHKKVERQLCLNLSSCILPTADPHIYDRLEKNENILGAEKKNLEAKKWMPDVSSKNCINGCEEEIKKDKPEPIYDLPYVSRSGSDLLEKPNSNINSNKSDVLNKKPEEGLHYLCTDVVGRLNHSLAEFSFEMNRTKSFGCDLETVNGNQSFSKLKCSSSLGNINDKKKFSAAHPHPLNALTMDADANTVTWDSLQTNGFEANSPKSGSDSCSTASTPENIDSYESSFSSITKPKAVKEEIEFQKSKKGEVILSKTGKKIDYITGISTKLFKSVPYWKQLKENDCSHLFECCLLVGLTFESEKNMPYIKTVFPPDVKPPPLIEALCFPDASNWPPNEENNTPEEQYYSLVVTNENGERKFGYCRRVLPEGGHLCLPLTYCIISPHRANGFFYKVLYELESRHGSPGIENFIMQLYESHFPGPGEGLQLKKILEKAKKNSPFSEEYISSTLVRRPCDVRLEEKDLTQLFEHLRLSEFLHVFSSLLHERKVLLLSNSLRKLSTCIEALQSILLPFSWQHTYIPILPAHLLEMCEAPTPYVIGLPKSKGVKQLLTNINFENGIVVDLDESKIVKFCGCEEFTLPDKLTKSLKYSLNLATNVSDLSDANKNVLISDAFISFFVQVCGHYYKFLRTSENVKTFEEKEFVNHVTSNTTRSFLEWFTKTAMFQAFIHERLHGGQDDVPAKLFTRRALENDSDALKNSTGIIKNYKVINKKVKTLGDKIRDFIQ